MDSNVGTVGGTLKNDSSNSPQLPGPCHKYREVGGHSCLEFSLSGNERPVTKVLMARGNGCCVQLNGVMRHYPVQQTLLKGPTCSSSFLTLGPLLESQTLCLVVGSDGSHPSPLDGLRGLNRQSSPPRSISIPQHHWLSGATRMTENFRIILRHQEQP